MDVYRPQTSGGYRVWRHFAKGTSGCDLRSSATRPAGVWQGAGQQSRAVECVMIIWGFRQRVLQLAMVTFLCGQCSNPSAHALRKAVNKFTLFFIPLFPISTKYFTQCTFCGCTNRITKEQADQVLAQAAPQQQGAPQQYQYPQQPQGQAPQQQYPQQPQPPQASQPQQPYQP
jgi:hypothetical protein